MNEYLRPESDPGEILALASSMAQRHIREQQWQQSVIAETIPLPPQPPVEIMQSIQVGATVAMLESLENPDAVIDPVSLMRTVIDDNTIADILSCGNKEPNEENISMLRAYIENQAKSIWEHFDDRQKAQQKIKDLLAVATTVAANHAVPVDEVFSEDELYAECIRMLDTPQTYIEDSKATIDKLSQDTMLSIAENVVDTMLQQEVANGEITADEYAREKDNVMQELLQDEALLAQINTGLSELQVAGQRLLYRGIERFWGKQALDELATTLGPEALELDGNITLSDGSHKQQQLNDIVATMCMEKGWDPNSLTIEQAKEIYSHPQVQQFRDQI